MMPALWGLLIKASVVLALAALAQPWLRRRASAATRHLVWTFAIASLLALPVMSAFLPAWRVALPFALPFALPGVTPAGEAADAAAVPALRTAAPAPASAPASGSPSTSVVPPTRLSGSASAALAGSAPEASAPEASAPEASAPEARAPQSSRSTRAPIAWDSSNAASAAAPWLLLYAAVALVLLLRESLQWWTLVRQLRRATPVTDPDWTRLFDASARSLGLSRPVRLLRSREQAMPMAFGILRPAVVIPAMADLWSEDRRRAVLLHELAHVARFDCLTQIGAALACAIYWPHPGVSWAARRLRVERELACDDRVLSAGTQAEDYADHLLEIAYAFGGHRAPALAVSMARPHELEGRLLAVLDASRNRTTPGLRGQIASGACMAALLVLLAAATGDIVSADRGPAGSAGDPRSAAADDQTPGATSPSAGTSRRDATKAQAQSSRTSQPSMLDARQPGTWEVHPGDEDGTVNVRLSDGRSSSGFSMPIDTLEKVTGLRRGTADGPVHFTLERDAGTFTFDGVFRASVGAGTVTFAANPNFAAEMVKRGFARPTAADQLALARSDIGFAYLDELTRQGYAKPDLALLVRAGHHGVGLDYLRGMGAAGHRLGELEPLIKLRDHGVTPDYIAGLAGLGYKGLSTEQLLKARDHGVSPDYVSGMRELGFGALPLEALIEARNHGITPGYVREIGELGHRQLPIETLIRIRDHGLTPDYIRGMRDLGYALPLDQLQKARDHGVDHGYVREMTALGYSRLPLDALIRARDHGITPSYVRELNELGYPRQDIDALVQLRDHGVTGDKIRRANTRAGTKLPLDVIRSMANGGFR